MKRTLTIDSALYRLQTSDYVERFSFWFDNVVVKLKGTWRDADGNIIPSRGFILNLEKGKNHFCVKMNGRYVEVFPNRPDKSLSKITIEGTFKEK